MRWNREKQRGRFVAQTLPEYHARKFVGLLRLGCDAWIILHTPSQPYIPTSARRATVWVHVGLKMRARACVCERVRQCLFTAKTSESSNGVKHWMVDKQRQRLWSTFIEVNITHTRPCTFGRTQTRTHTQSLRLYRSFDLLASRAVDCSSCVAFFFSLFGLRF